MRFLPCSSFVVVSAAALLCAGLSLAPLASPQAAVAKVAATSSTSSSAVPSGGTDSLEQAAKRAGDTGRKVAMYLIGLAFAFAAVLLVFKRDFREAAAIFGVGILAVLLATPSGLETLQSTVNTLFR
jgi:hypothetical protein